MYNTQLSRPRVGSPVTSPATGLPNLWQLWAGSPPCRGKHTQKVSKIEGSLQWRRCQVPTAYSCINPAAGQGLNPPPAALGTCSPPDKVQQGRGRGKGAKAETAQVHPSLLRPLHTAEAVAPPPARVVWAAGEGEETSRMEPSQDPQHTMP
jgi:hypothetical protein